MKRSLFLLIGLSILGAGCWSSQSVEVVSPPPADEPPAAMMGLPDAMQPPTTTPDAMMMGAPTTTPPSTPSATGTTVMQPPTTPQRPVISPDEPVYADVMMSQDGFRPAQLTIKKNTIVRFKNVGEGNMWPASNPHPNHTDYQDFDARRRVKPGETYEFKFARLGTWGYHDHLNPGLTGRIVVEE